MTLPEWLAFIERQHARPIALGLERVARVSASLNQNARIACPLILVGGTNGKGSTCAMLEAVLLRAGYRVGLYSSPHLLRYNERVRVNGSEADEAALCAGFARVEAARGDTPLTYFEYGTLCALEVFLAQPLEPLDALILEVGLGGRLDATNVYAPDCAIVSSVDLDHMDFLGDTREKIGFEKAGIFRSGKPAFCGDAHPPQSLLDHAQNIGAQLQVMGRDYGYVRETTQWQYWNASGKRAVLAHPGLRGERQLANAATVMAALHTLREKLPVAMQDIRRGLIEVELPGRFQVLPGRPAVVLDVAHNVEAARVLAANLGKMGFYRKTWAVFGMLRDKDIAGVIDALKMRVDHWLPATLSGPRAARCEELAGLLEKAGVAGSHGQPEGPLMGFATPAAAYAHALEWAGADDRILVFGSFLTVAEIIEIARRKT